MSKKVLFLIPLLFGLATSAPVSAKGNARQEAIDRMAETMTNMLIWLSQKQWQEGETGLDRYLAAPKCMDLVAAAKKAGVADGDNIEGYWDRHPKAVKVANSNKTTITLAEAVWVCEQWDRRLATEPTAIYIRFAVTYQKDNPNDYAPEKVAMYSKGAGDASIKRGQKCIAGIAELDKAGMANDTLVLADGSSITFADGKAACEYVIGHATRFNATIAEAHGAKRGEIAAKYEKLGVKGDRLELFIEYDNVSFRGKKCEIIDDIKKLVKAKYVYQWLENSDYTHTIRKYTFKGNKYKVSEKTYTTEAKAYKGCK